MTLAFMSCIRFPSHVRVSTTTSCVFKVPGTRTRVRVFHRHKTQNIERASEKPSFLVKYNNIMIHRQNR